MQLSEEKTYRTRDGSRRGIRVKRWEGHQGLWYEAGTRPTGTWANDGRQSVFAIRDHDLFEDTVTTDPRPFSYADCPMGEDGRRRAVTRGGARVVLLCSDAPGEYPIRGYEEEHADGQGIYADRGGIISGGIDRLLVPPPPKRVVWVNLYEGNVAAQFSSQAEADETDQRKEWPLPRLGNRAYPIEIDGDAP